MTVDEQAIHTMVGQLEAGWNAGDGVGFASHFTDDASFIHTYGGEIDGGVAIEAVHRQILDTLYKGSHNEYTVLGIRFVRPDVAIVLVRAHLQFYEGGEPREIPARPTMIGAEEDGIWQVVVFQNTRISEMPGAAKAANSAGS
jgi:uncharacterized protein (TIGR02246 family)